MKMLRLRVVCVFAKMMCVPIKVRESFWLGPDQHASGSGTTASGA